MSNSDNTVTDNHETGIQFGPKKLNLVMEPGVSRLNVYTLLFGSFFGIAMMSFVNTCQAYLFEEVLLIPQSEQGVVAGNMTFVSEIVAESRSTLQPLLFLRSAISCTRLPRPCPS
jgi:hypothetical protein